MPYREVIHTVVQVTREDRARLERLKIHPAQPAREVVAAALDALERERRAQKAGPKRLAS